MRDRVHQDQGGVLQSLPGWLSATTGYAMEFGWCNVDPDDDLDLAVAGGPFPIARGLLLPHDASPPSHAA